MKTSRAKSKEIKSLDGLRMERIEFGVLYLYVFDGNLGISNFFFCFLVILELGNVSLRIYILYTNLRFFRENLCKD